MNQMNSNSLLLSIPTSRPGKSVEFGNVFPGKSDMPARNFLLQHRTFWNFYAVNKKFALGVHQLSSRADRVKLFYFQRNVFLSTAITAGLMSERNKTHYRL